jgi:hypothetical protein
VYRILLHNHLAPSSHLNSCNSSCTSAAWAFFSFRYNTSRTNLTGPPRLARLVSVSILFLTSLCLHNLYPLQRSILEFVLGAKPCLSASVFSFGSRQAFILVAFPPLIFLLYINFPSRALDPLHCLCRPREAFINFDFHLFVYSSATTTTSQPASNLLLLPIR